MVIWLRLAAVVAVTTRLIRGVSARPPVNRPGGPLGGTSVGDVTVVVPARDEAGRIAPLLAALRGAPGVVEVIVVDDGSTDGTAALAAAAGAVVVVGGPPPAGWTGKVWAVAQGVRAAGTQWVVTLDADVIPDPELPSAVVARAVADGIDLLTVGGRAELPNRPSRWLHAAMLTQLVYRFGPPGSSRRLANGQCMAASRTVLLDGLTAVSGSMVEDVAVARHLSASGRRVDFLDATDLMLVRPYRSFADVWWGWGRSIGLRGVEPPWRQVLELALLMATLVVPPVRVARRTADSIDAVALALRIGTLVGTRRADADGGVAYWASPLADPLALAATVSGLLRPSPIWRGRRVGRSTTRSRSGTRRRSSRRR